ncbi:AbrB/MazE/SpoVT family DNA-binding domain-containing protein [Cryobacterium frigoriphilum]|nr:AbrB/MazE/SpoVT family DNA-binding domain-containing protein [Cryobacterium frigoriphilum]
MKTVVTLGSKGQLTVPAAVREALHLERGDRFEISIDEAAGALTLTLIPGIEALRRRISGYAALTEPVTDVDACYHAHRRRGPGGRIDESSLQS